MTNDQIIATLKVLETLIDKNAEGKHNQLILALTKQMVENVKS